MQQIPGTIVRLVMFPLIQFLVYGVSISLASQLIIPSTLTRFTQMTALTFVLAVCGTLVLHTVHIALFRNGGRGDRSFRNWFEYGNLYFVFASGFFAVCIALKPYLHFSTPNLSKQNVTFLGLICFVALMTYAIYKPVFITDDIEIKVLNSIKDKVIGLEQKWRVLVLVLSCIVLVGGITYLWYHRGLFIG